MASRLELQTILETLIGSENVYFQPPTNAEMDYPCIVYSLDDAKTKFGDNKPYINAKRYQIVSVDQDPDSKIPDKIAELSTCVRGRHYVADNLNHEPFYIYF